MRKARIAVLVSGGGTNLQALLEAQQSGIIHSGEIVLVVSSNPNAYALKRAESFGVKTSVADIKSCRESGEKNAFEKELLSVLKANDIDLIILAGFMCILSREFVSRYPERIINVHPSLIPSFCGEGYYGLKVHEAALAYGVKVTGATVHFVNEVPDGGRIILQKAVEIREGDSPEILQRRVMEEAEWKLLPLAAELVAQSIVR